MKTVTPTPQFESLLNKMLREDRASKRIRRRMRWVKPKKFHG